MSTTGLKQKQGIFIKYTEYDIKVYFLYFKADVKHQNVFTFSKFHNLYVSLPSYLQLRFPLNTK